MQGAKKPAPFITKGDKIQVKFFSSQPLGTWSLAGFQDKLTGTFVEVIGTCVHFRGDRPTEPKETRVYIDVTEGELPTWIELKKPHGCTHEKGHLEVREEWIIGVEKDGQTYKTIR